MSNDTPDKYHRVNLVFKVEEDLPLLTAAKHHYERVNGAPVSTAEFARYCVAYYAAQNNVTVAI